MSKIEALREIVYEAQRAKMSKAGLRRIQKAAKALGLTDKEVRELESTLEYRPSADEEIYPRYK